MADKENFITHVAGDLNGPRIAAIERHGKTQVWDIASRERISRFNTIVERISRRIAIGSTGQRLAVGTYNGNGVSLYDTESGREIWNRPDLNQVQKVRFSSTGDSVFVAFNEHQGTFLECKTGRSKRLSLFKKYASGIKDIYQSQVDPIFVREPWDDSLQISTEKHVALNSIPRKTFGVIDYSFSPDQLCITESTGPVTCYNVFSGMENWEFDPGDGVHGLCISFVSHLDAYATIVWPYENGGDHTFYLLNRITGDIINNYVVPEGNPAFIHAGRQMVFTKGAVVDTASGETTHNLEFMAGIAG